MGNDTIKKTILVAATLCIVCSIFVSSASVVLRPIQNYNKDQDKKRNILVAAKLYEEGKTVDELFSKVDPLVVDIENAKILEDFDADSFDLTAALKSKDESIALSQSKDLPGIKRRANKAVVYAIRNESGGFKQLILPIYGKGLWSTLWGYIALDQDLSTIIGLAFYQHGETPGLGGEVDNPSWKAQWSGKVAYDDKGEVVITVLKGKVDPSSETAKSQIDGLAGATITTRGVDNLVKFWLGPDGFGPIIAKYRNPSEGVTNGE